MQHKKEEKAMMKMINLEKLANVVGGSHFDDVYAAYERYTDKLFAKYGKHSVRKITGICTPKEKAKILEFWDAINKAALEEAAALGI
jgi:hypothetical protein